MTEKQKEQIMSLIYGMPFLGANTVSRDDFVDGLIANLEILKEKLEYHASHHQAVERELREYKEAARGLQFLLGQTLNSPDA